jgi:hypothetical protein
MTLIYLSTGTTEPHFLLDDGEWLALCSGEFIPSKKLLLVH